MKIDVISELQEKLDASNKQVLAFERSLWYAEIYPGEISEEGIATLKERLQGHQDKSKMIADCIEYVNNLPFD